MHTHLCYAPVLYPSMLSIAPTIPYALYYTYLHTVSTIIHLSVYSQYLYVSCSNHISVNSRCIYDPAWTVITSQNLVRQNQHDGPLLCVTTSLSTLNYLLPCLKQCCLDDNSIHLCSYCAWLRLTILSINVFENWCLLRFSIVFRTSSNWWLFYILFVTFIKLVKWYWFIISKYTNIWWPLYNSSRIDMHVEEIIY